MQKYKSNIITTSGAAVRNVPVTVLKEDGSLASLFLDRDGNVAAPNPLKTGADGTFYFYAVNGRYGLRTTVDGVSVVDSDAVLLMDPEELTVAGPIATAVAAAEASALRAENAVATSGIVDLVANAQNALIDANNAKTQAISSASSADMSSTAAAASAASASTSAAQADASAIAAAASAASAALTSGYASKTVSANTTLAADTEYETGRNLRINHGVNLAIPASTKLIVRKYAAGSSL